MLKLNISSGSVLEQLKLPVPLDEFKRKVDEIRAAGQPNIAPTVLNADSSVPALNWHLQQTSRVRYSHLDPWITTPTAEGRSCQECPSQIEWRMLNDKRRL